MKDEITIAIPTYRRLDLLKEALKSAVNQRTKRSYNIIVISNDVEDDIINGINRIIQDYGTKKIKFHKNDKNIGMVGNWNRCIELAETSWVSILNDDDILLPNYIDYMSDVIATNKGYGMYVSRKHILDQRKLTLKIFTRKILDKIKSYRDECQALLSKGRKLSVVDYSKFNITGNSLCAVFSTEMAKKIGGFDEKYYPSFDYKFNVEMSTRYGVFESFKRLGYWRVLANETLNMETYEKFEKIDKIIQEEIKKNILAPQKKYENNK